MPGVTHARTITQTDQKPLMACVLVERQPRQFGELILVMRQPRPDPDADERQHDHHDQHADEMAIELAHGVTAAVAGSGFHAQPL